MKGFYLAASKHGGDGLRYIGRRRKAAAIGLINLIYNLARYEPRHRMSGLPAA